MDDITILKRLNKQPGSLVRVRKGRHKGVWLKLDPRVVVNNHELESSWVCLQNGSVRHYSWLADPIFPLEIVREGAEALSNNIRVSQKNLNECASCGSMWTDEEAPEHFEDCGQ